MAKPEYTHLMIIEGYKIDQMIFKNKFPVWYKILKMQRILYRYDEPIHFVMGLLNIGSAAIWLLLDVISDLFKRTN